MTGRTPWIGRRSLEAICSVYLAQLDNLNNLFRVRGLFLFRVLKGSRSSQVIRDAFLQDTCAGQCSSPSFPCRLFKTSLFLLPSTEVPNDRPNKHYFWCVAQWALIVGCGGASSVQRLFGVRIVKLRVQDQTSREAELVKTTRSHPPPHNDNPSTSSGVFPALTNDLWRASCTQKAISFIFETRGHYRFPPRPIEVTMNADC